MSEHLIVWVEEMNIYSYIKIKKEIDVIISYTLENGEFTTNYQKTIENLAGNSKSWILLQQ